MNSESAVVSAKRPDFCCLHVLHAYVEFISLSSNRNIYRSVLFSERERVFGVCMSVLTRGHVEGLKDQAANTFFV